MAPPRSAWLDQAIHLAITTTMTHREICEHVGGNIKTLRRWLRKKGITRPRGGIHMRPGWVGKAIALRKRGRTHREIADTVGVSPSSVGRWLARSGHGTRKRRVRRWAASQLEKLVPRETLERLYVSEEQHATAVATAMGVDRKTIAKALDHYGIYRRGPSDLRGEKAVNWKGGRRMTAQGYIAIYCPDHPNAWPETNCVFEHRLVMEKHLGRHLDRDESVHHKDGDRTNNALSNLELRVKAHGWGQSVDDVVQQSVAYLKRYAPHLLA